MKTALSSIVSAITLVFLSGTSFAQIPNLGSVSSFVLYTVSGAVGNTGLSNINGNIGSDVGAITGFGAPSTVNGTIYNADGVTAQCAIDLQAAYVQLNSTVATNTTHTPAFGSGETLTPGIYAIGGAGSVAGTLILDAQSDTNAVFIFKFGGAFTTGAVSTIVLANGTSPCNVFWIAEGAISMATLTSMEGTLIAHNGAASMGASCTLDGRLFSTTGAVSVYAVNAAVPVNCLSTIWTGAAGTTDWFTNGNWTRSTPGSTIKALIPNGLIAGRVYPIVDSGIANVDTIVIQSAATLVVTNSTLQVNGNIANSGLFTASNGSIVMNGTVPQTIQANTFLNNSVLNLSAGDLTIAGPQNITGTLAFKGSMRTLATNGFVTFKSTDSGSARLADITNGGIDNGNIITGNVTIERYIPGKRAWRLLSAPLDPTGAPTINAAWQEGSTSGDPLPGYGTQITGGSVTNGYDQGINSNPSLKFYTNSGNIFTGIPIASGTNVAITSYPGYFLFVRGNRSTNLLQGIYAPLSNTVLRMKGKVNTGNISSTVNALGYTLIGNPYPAAVDFHTLTKTNVNDQFYLWDPKLAGIGYGSYVSFIWNSGSNTYDATASVSPVSRYISSGEAFFVQSTDGINPGTLTIKETDKNTGGSDLVFRPIAADQKLRINLFGISVDSSASLLDGVLTCYNDKNANSVDNNDAMKLYNLSENIGIGRDGHVLAIERRHSISNNDTTFLKLYTLKKQNYKLQITTEAMEGNTLQAVISDKYSAVINNTPVKISGTTEVIFNVNTDSASFSPDRFSIIFNRLLVLTNTFTAIKAYSRLKDIVLEWSVTGGLNIKNYEVETSATGDSFTTAATLPAGLNNNGKLYDWLDKNASAGAHYYRIKSVDSSGKISYSLVVKATVPTLVNLPAIAVYGNSIRNGTCSVQFKYIERGVYTLCLYDGQGQLVKKLLISHQGGLNITHDFRVNNYLPVGTYQLLLSGKSIELTIPVIKN